MRGWLAPLIAALVSLSVSAPALAATATITGSGQSKVIHYSDTSGEQNSIYAEVDQQSGKVRLFEQSFDPAIVINPGSGCTADGSSGKSVLCSTQGVVSVQADMGDGDDSFQAYAAFPTVVNGGPGNDQLTGSTTSDTLDGGTGDDLIWDHGDADGSDVVIGGDGFDTAAYSSHGLALTLSLDGSANDGAAGENDNLHADIEKLVGGQGGDTLTGTSGPDWLVGVGGGNTLHGGGGNDTLDGSDYCSNAPDALDAGPGDDTVLAGCAASVDAGAGDDVVTADDIYSGAIIAGGDGSDELQFTPSVFGYDISLDDVANDGHAPSFDANVASDFEELRGGSGADILSASDTGTILDGAYGNDTLIGGPGGDALQGGVGDDLLDGGGGADTMAGGDGSDAVDYSSRTLPLHVDLDGQPDDDGEGGEGDTVATDVEGIYGGSGNDALTGGPGDDLLDGGPGADQLAGGDGEDVVDYSARTGAVSADTDGAPGDDGESGEGDSIAADVEDIYGGAGVDTLTGNGSGNFLFGGPGDDALVGGEGDDVLAGGSGNDSLDGGAGADAYYGEEGDDTIAMRDGVVEAASCGDGFDSVAADAGDQLDPDCENASRPVTATPLPTRTPLPPRPSPVKFPIAAPLPSATDRIGPRAVLAPVKTPLKRALARGQRIHVSCDEYCATDLELTLSVRAAKRLGFKHVKSPLVVATASRPAADEKSYDVVLRFKRTFRARLGKARTLAFRIHAAFTDPLANDAAIIRVLKLTR